MDRWLKRLWLAIGALALPLLLFAAWAAASGWLGSRRNAGSAVQLPNTQAGNRGTTPRAVRATLPDSILGSRYKLVRVHYGEAQGYGGEALSENYSGSSGYQGRTEGAVVNVAFIAADHSEATLLLDQPAFVRRIDAPSNTADSLQRWIAYEIALQDSNKDGRLDGADAIGLYATDLNGAGLRKISPDSLEYESYRWTTPDQVLIAGLELPRNADEAPRIRRRQLFYRYELGKGVALRDTALNAALGRAATLLRR